MRRVWNFHPLLGCQNVGLRVKSSEGSSGRRQSGVAGSGLARGVARGSHSSLVPQRDGVTRLLGADKSDRSQGTANSKMKSKWSLSTFIIRTNTETQNNSKIPATRPETWSTRVERGHSQTKPYLVLIFWCSKIFWSPPSCVTPSDPYQVGFCCHVWCCIMGPSLHCDTCGQVRPVVFTFKTFLLVLLE